MVHLFLVRHGETFENTAKILQGHLPGHLTDAGRSQAIELREVLLKSNIHFDKIITSDLKRAIDTTNIINETFNRPVITTRLLRERDWGSITGFSLAEKPSVNFPDDVESIPDLFTRAKDFLSYILTHYNNQTILAVGHGLFNRCIIASVYGQTIQDIPPMKNAEIRKLLIRDSSFPTRDTPVFPASN